MVRSNNGGFVFFYLLVSTIIFWRSYSEKLPSDVPIWTCDPEAPETVPDGLTGWRVLLRIVYLKYLGWKKCALFQVPEDLAKAGYYVGYKTVTGEVMISRFRKKGMHFRMLTGRETCGFFIVDRNGTPKKLTLVADRQLINHLMQMMFPIY